MNTRRLPEPGSIKNLRALAEVLRPKTREATQPLVICLIGAGASASAGLPLAEELKIELRGALNQAVPGNLLNAELVSVFGLDESEPADQVFQRISFFDFATLVTRFELGRQCLDRLIEDNLGKSTHRPLACELAAHFAKHRYFDHLIVVNFDPLLKEAVEDELPERSQFIVSPRDVPSRDEFSRDLCYVVYPFGLLNRKPYSITLKDVSDRFGPEPVDRFLRKNLPRSRGDGNQPVVLVTLGYSASEKSFELFARSLCTVPGTARSRKLMVYSIDITSRSPLEANVDRLRGEGRDVELSHIGADADVAMELLLQLIEEAVDEEPMPVPAARHKIISRCFDYSTLRDQGKRFEIELLLQAVKSRGFIQLEAFSHVRRLVNRGGPHVREIIDSLLERKVLEKDEWLGVAPQFSAGQRYVPNLMVTDDASESSQATPSSAMEKVITALSSHSPNHPDVVEYRAERDNTCIERRIPWRQYIERRLGEISRAPEIEVVPDSSPEAAWLLGVEAEPLPSIESLTCKSTGVLDSAIRTAHEDMEVVISGIWSTGEWLFHKDGWAYRLGKALLEEDRIALRVIITQTGGKSGLRTQRRSEVIHMLHEHPRVEVRALRWSELNRILTMVEVPAVPDRNEAIYMKRRLACPVVTPFRVSGGLDIAYLGEVFDWYWRAADDAGDAHI